MLVNYTVSKVLLHYDILITNKIIHNKEKGKRLFAFCYFISFSKSLISLSEIELCSLLS